MTFWLCVFVRIITNPLSNVLQKALTREQMSPLVIVGVAHGLLSLVSLPWLVFHPPPVAAEFWTNMAASALLAVAANAMIVQALKISDLSFLGPVNAYKSVVSLVPGFVLLHEVPSIESLMGLALIVAGSYLVVDRDGGNAARGPFLRFFSDRGVQYRLGGLVLSAIEAVFLKRALAASSLLGTFAIWSLAGFALSAIAVFMFSRDSLALQNRILKARRVTCFTLAATTGVMQLSTLAILIGFQVASALALFQTSTLLTVFLGWRLFREPHFARRLAGSVVTVAGAVLIVLSR